MFVVLPGLLGVLLDEETKLAGMTLSLLLREVSLDVLLERPAGSWTFGSS